MSMAVWNQWNGIVEWNTGMIFYPYVEGGGCYELQHHNGSRIRKCRY